MGLKGFAAAPVDERVLSTTFPELEAVEGAAEAVAVAQEGMSLSPEQSKTPEVGGSSSYLAL